MMIKRIFFGFIGALGCFCILGEFLSPQRVGHNGRRSSCQSNLEQIGLAIAQYTQDYDERLPLRRWKAPLWPYLKTEMIFQCAETTATAGTSDYFFNARFSEASMGAISSPKTLIFLGDGRNDAPLEATLSQLPEAWRKDENSPAWRHLGTANYLFADGHVEALKVNHVNRDFRMVNQ